MRAPVSNDVCAKIQCKTAGAADLILRKFIGTLQVDSRPANATFHLGQKTPPGGSILTCATPNAQPQQRHGLDQDHTYPLRHGLDDLNLRGAARPDLLET